MTLNEVIERIKEIWNQSALPKIMAALIGFGLFLLLLTFLPVVIGVVALAVVAFAIYMTWFHK